MNSRAHFAIVMATQFILSNVANASLYSSLNENGPVVTSSTKRVFETAYVLSSDFLVSTVDIEEDHNHDEQNFADSFQNAVAEHPGLMDVANVIDLSGEEEPVSSVVMPAGTRFTISDGVIDESDGEKYVQVQTEDGFQFWTKLSSFEKADYIGEVEVAARGRGHGRAGAVSSRTGWRKMGGKVKCHEGTDITYPVGTPVGARGGAGKVTKAGWMNGYGKVVEIDHGGNMMSRYAHLSVISVRAGQRVSKGQNIGKVGMTGRTTGPHLHYEYKRKGTTLCGKKRR